MFLLLAIGGAAAAYYFSKQGTSNQPLASGPALPPPGGGAPPGGTNAPPPASKDEPEVSGIVNDTTGKAATAKEKQQGLNWLQATILKACNKSIYNPFTASDLASNSFGPKSRAALAVADKLMRESDAGLSKTVKRNLFASGTAGDAALQALVTAVTAPSPDVLPNAAEIQALVKAAGGAGSIGAPSPVPTPPTGAKNSSVIEVGTMPPDWVRLIRTRCNYVADRIDSQITFGRTKGLRVPFSDKLTYDAIDSFRRVLALYATVAAHSGNSHLNDVNLGRFPVARVPDVSKYTMFRQIFMDTAAGAGQGGRDSQQIARFDPTVLDWFNARAKTVIDDDLASLFEDAYDALSAGGDWNSPLTVPFLRFNLRDVAEEYPGKQFVFAKS